MTDQSNIPQVGTFFGVKSDNHDKMFIGFTTNKMSLRKAFYTYKHKNWIKNGRPEDKKTFIFELLDQPDHQFFLIEKFQFFNEKEKKERELSLKKEFGEKLGKIRMPLFSKEEYMERNRQRASEYYQKRMAMSDAEQFKQKRQQNARDWYANNRDKSLARHKEYVKNKQKCECGSVFVTSKEKHLKSTLHKKNMLSLSNGSISSTTQSTANSAN